jgi:hypothetical protein
MQLSRTHKKAPWWWRTYIETCGGCRILINYQNIAFVGLLYIFSQGYFFQKYTKKHLTDLLHGVESFSGKLTVSHPVKKFSAFYWTWRFITAFTSPRQINSVHAPIPVSEDPSKYYLPIYVWVFHAPPFLQVSLPKPCMHLSSSPYVLHVPSVPFFSIWSLEWYLVRSADH